MLIPYSQFILFFIHSKGDSLGISEFQSFLPINSLILLLLCYFVSSSYCYIFGHSPFVIFPLSPSLLICRKQVCYYYDISSISHSLFLMVFLIYNSLWDSALNVHSSLIGSIFVPIFFVHPDPKELFTSFWFIHVLLLIVNPRKHSASFKSFTSFMPLESFELKM